MYNDILRLITEIMIIPKRMDLKIKNDKQWTN